LTDSGVKFELDLKSRVPIYIQIVDQVKEMIAAGRIRPGAKLPTVRQVAVDLMINPNTVSRAFLELEHAGLIESQRGVGSFISENIGSDYSKAETRRQTEKLLRGFLRGMMALGHSPGDILEAVKDAVKRKKE
jgi:GntR family transcriptional regulator